MLRFTIRDVLWLTVVVAMACAWWLDRAKVARENREMAEQFMNLTSTMNAEQNELRKEVSGLHGELAEEALEHWRTTRKFLLADREAWQEERKRLLARVRELEMTIKAAPISGP